MDESLRNVDAIADDTDSDLDSDDDEDDFILIENQSARIFAPHAWKGRYRGICAVKDARAEDGARAALFDACRAMLEGFDDDSQSPDLFLQLGSRRSLQSSMKGAAGCI